MDWEKICKKKDKFKLQPGDKFVVVKQVNDIWGGFEQTIGKEFTICHITKNATHLKSNFGYVTIEESVGIYFDPEEIDPL